MAVFFFFYAYTLVRVYTQQVYDNTETQCRINFYAKTLAAIYSRITSQGIS